MSGASPIGDQNGFRIDPGVVLGVATTFLSHAAAPASTIQPSTAAPPPTVLSGKKRAVNFAYNAFWGAASLTGRIGIPSFVKKWAAKKVVGWVVNPAVEALPTPEPETPLKSLRTHLFNLHGAAAANIEIPSETRQAAAAVVDDLLQNEKNYLKDAKNPNTGWRAYLDYDYEERVKRLSTTLKSNLPIIAAEVKFLFDLVDGWWKLEQQFYQNLMTELVAAKVTGAAPPAMPPPLVVTELVAAKVTGAAPPAMLPPLVVTEPPPVRTIQQIQPPPRDAIPEIIQQVDELKSVVFKIALAFLILPESSLKKEDDENGGLIADLIQKAADTVHHEKNSNEIFQDLIFTELDNAKMNIVTRTWKKLCCLILAPTLLYILDYLLEKTKKDLLYLIGLSPEGRLDLIVKTVINPGLEFVNKLQKFYHEFSQNQSQFQGTLDQERSFLLAHLVLQDKNRKSITPGDLINRLIGTLLTRYSSAFSWTDSAVANYFETRSKQTERTGIKIWFYAWSWISWIYFVALSPLRWCLHQTVRKIVKTTATSILSSKLIDSQDASWDFGKLALKSIYKTLLGKRQEKKNETPASKAKINPAIQQTAFVDRGVQQTINQLISRFLKIIEYEGRDRDDLADEVNLLDQLKKTGKKLIYEPGIQKATENIIEGLQIFLERESCSALIADVLADVNRQCLQLNLHKTGEGLAEVEREFYEELGKTLKEGIGKVISEVRDPTRRIQQEADLFIDGLRYDVNLFVQESRLTVQIKEGKSIHDIKKLKASYDKNLEISFGRRCERAKEGTNPSTAVQVKACADEYTRDKAPVCETLDQLLILSKTKKEAEETVKRLELLLNSLSKIEFPFTEVQGALQRVKNKLYPQSVQDRIAALQRAFQDNRTETAKKNNQSHIENVIALLKTAVKASIKEHNGQTAEFQRQIGLGYVELLKRADQLAAWTGELRYFQCGSAASELGAVQNVLGLLNQYTPQIDIEGKLAGFIIKQVEGFGHFLRKDHNIKAPLWFVLKAFLELRSPPDYDKVAESVRPKKQS